jgi:hypothetical protein
MFPALFADVAEQFGRTVINILAVAGSAAVGYILTFILIWTICRLTIHKQPPRSLAKVLSALGAIAAGVVVAMLLFNGGGGWGLGAGFGFGGGSGTAQGPTEKSPPTQSAPPKTTQTTFDPSQVAAPLRVRVLGGKISSKKFYGVEGEIDARDLKSIIDLLGDRVGKKPAVRELIIVLKGDDAAGYNAPAVTDLDSEAKRFGLSVGYDPPPEKPK